MHEAADDHDEQVLGTCQLFPVRLGQRLWFSAFAIAIPTALLHVERGPWMLLVLALGVVVFLLSRFILPSPAPFEGVRYLDVTTRAFKVRHRGVVLAERPLTDFVDVTARWARTKWTGSKVTMHFEDGTEWRFGTLGASGTIVDLVNTLSDEG